MGAALGQAFWPQDQVFRMSKQVVTVARIRQRRATVDTARGGQVGRCSKPDHSHSVQQPAQAAQAEYALDSDLANFWTCRRPSACSNMMCWMLPRLAITGLQQTSATGAG
jgi:hypothetical protein